MMSNSHYRPFLSDKQVPVYSARAGDSEIRYINSLRQGNTFSRMQPTLDDLPSVDSFLQLSAYEQLSAMWTTQTRDVRN